MRRADDAEVVQIGERTRYEPGTFCWVGLATSDPGSAKAFYTSLFGWQAGDLEAGAAGTYTTLRHGGEEVAILYMQQPEARAAGEMLGWEYETNDSGYGSIINAGRRNGGMRQQTEEERGTPPSWLPYFTVESADEAARQAEQLGGRTLLPNTEIHIGRFAVIADRQGAAFAVFEGETDP